MTDVITAKIKINFMDTQMGNRFTQGQVRAGNIWNWQHKLQEDIIIA